MPDYKEALRRGLDAQAKLEQAKLDVAQVLEEVGSDLSELLGQGVQFKLGKGIRTVEGIQTKIGEMMGYLPKKIREEIWTLQVSKEGIGTITLAEVEFAETGYPISLTWPGQYSSIDQRDDLGAALTGLLSSRHAGEKLSPLVVAPQPQ